MGVVGLVVLLGIVGVAAWLGARLSASHLALVDRVGRRSGLTYGESSDVMEGQWRGYPLRLGTQRLRMNTFNVAILELPGGTALDTMVASSGASSGVFTGDPAFDARYSVSGPPTPLSLVVLTDDIRQRMTAFEGRVDIDGGRLILFYKADDTALEADLVRLAALADTLILAGQTDDLPLALMRRAFEDPVPGARREAARALLESYPAHARDLGFMEAARRSHDSALRLLAAEIDGPGLGLAGALDVLEGGWSPPEARLEAAHLLLRWHPPMEPVRRALASVVATQHGALLHAVLELYAVYDECPPVSLVERRLRVVSNADSLALLQTLSNAAERDRAPAATVARRYLFAKDASMAQTACEVLAAVGTIDAVEVLYSVAESDTRPVAVKSAARNAIAAIQLKSGRSELRGGLELAPVGVDRGALSPARTQERGGLEVAEEMAE